MSRRSLLAAAAAGTAGFVVGRFAEPLSDAVGMVRPPQGADPSLASPPPPAPVPSAAPVARAAVLPAAVPFFGTHQGGIVTPPQAHLRFAAFDMVPGADRRDLDRLLRDWSTAAARLCEGRAIGDGGATAGDPDLPPDDTGETIDLGPARLTVTFGLGPALFERDGVDRFGIADRRPTALRPLPAFAGDQLELSTSDGDLGIQVCADDPVVALHAVRNLARVAFRRATIRWTLAGFREAPADGQGPVGHRNLMGFRDGTANIESHDAAALARHVWLPPDSGDRTANGTYLVIRKIRIHLAGWDNEPLRAQEQVFGRRKRDGAPLSGGGAGAGTDLAARLGGRLAIDPAAHVRLAHPSSNGGIRLLRRGYDYVEGLTAEGCIDGGMAFISFQRSPADFVTVQRSLASDLLNDYTVTIGSALFFVPPGASPGGSVGEALLA